MAFTTRNGKVVRVEKDYKGRKFVREDRYREQKAEQEAYWASINKGKYRGACNRSGCLRPGAYWYNHGSQAYYCDECASRLNTYNPDAERIYGHPMCTMGEYTEGETPAQEGVAALSYYTDQESTLAQRSFPEDAGHENGQYQCSCTFCAKVFIGHKRRVACKVCESIGSPLCEAFGV